MSKADSGSTFDPMKAWRDWVVGSEREWSEAVSQITKNDAVARALGQEVNAAVYRQQMLTQSMAAPMAMMNMPTRDDIVALGERIGRLEDAVARVEAAVVNFKGAGTADVPRTRQAPRKPANSS